ncbi:MAG: hypothetical protein IPH07_13835 [Deltaproteobacteria bacterium]|nr:hypothetical protein [Deltaproteobacteria bacterium]MBK8241238.1 hypothetical protein [Deltaproteobacteria bacterium]MBK8716837.1 hypothetical protein [Deltaproteobacteria bacterium]MBP7286944.1 hypothetical protein [Nannocystaceae bacterium]
MAVLTSEWREFLSLLISHRVKFVVVGGHAIAVHARARTTEDLDVVNGGAPLPAARPTIRVDHS